MRGWWLMLTAVGGVAGYLAGTPQEVAPQCLISGSRPHVGMVWVAPGRFRMGSEEFRAEEAPRVEQSVAGFWIDPTDVTNAQFARFVGETGYVTVAERVDATTGRQAGSLVFKMPEQVTGAGDPGLWWSVMPGADWRHPTGAGSVSQGDHPVVHVAYEDAATYARWAGHDLPSEAQWEFAARAGRDDAFIWGKDADPDAKFANHWRGSFPLQPLGVVGTSPVGCYQPNELGLYDMTGNVWQWTSAPWTASHASGPADPTAYVIKGGSFLCATNFCLRYRPAARQPGDAGSGASHIGFRTVLNP